jgi:integrase
MTFSVGSKYYTEDEEYRALRACKENFECFYPIMYFCLKTGARFGEMASLAWTDVNFSAKTVSISRSYDDVSRTVKATKNGKERTIPLSTGTHELLAVLRLTELSKNNYIFLDPQSRSIAGLHSTCNGFLDDINKVCEINKHITMHGLRHTFATVSKLLGHSSPNTTMRYLHTNEKTKQNAIDLLG